MNYCNILLSGLFCLVLSSCNGIQYNENVALTSVNLCQASYCVNDYNWDCATCNPENKLEYIIENHGEKALMGFNDETSNIFVAFRGSENILNWLDNIQFRKISPFEDVNIKVEKGFYKAYQYLKPDLLNKLNKLKEKYNTNNILLTGHSLGASLATLFGYDILTNYNNYVLNYLITFGSPRVGNSYFVEDFKQYNLIHYRITHYYDMVPHVPQEFLGYLHIPSEIWYNEDNTNYQLCNDNYETEDDLCSNSCSPFQCTSSDDHLYYLNVSLGIYGYC